jgi:hypothetical protein
MGRPIKKKFFGNLNKDQITGSTNGVGGEGVASAVPLNSGTLYTTSTTLALDFTAPQIAGGLAATGNVTTNESGNVLNVNLSQAGSGYLSAPTATVAGGTTGTTATFTVSLTSTQDNALAVYAFVPGGASAVLGDIVKQESTNRYLVKTAQGQGQCKLITTSTAVAGEMYLIATDVNGSTYYVNKLTAHKARLTHNTVNGSFEFASGDMAPWGIVAATTGTVNIANN